MPNTRSRKLIVVLAAGALSMFGASSAFADHGGDHGGGGGGGGDPMCKGTPLAATPLCGSSGEQPPGGGEGGGGGGGQPSATLAGEGGGEAPLPLCGPPLNMGGACDKPGGEGDDNSGGKDSGGQPSAQPADEGGGGNKPDQPYCNNTPLQGTPLCAPSPGEGGEDGGQDPKG